jgi:hypothetical protein
MSTLPTSPEDDKLQFGKSWLMVIFRIFICVDKINVQGNVTNVSMFVCITVLNSKYMQPFLTWWPQNLQSELFYTGVQSNVNEDDTSQWKLWIGIYLKCIDEQGEYFLHNSKNKRNRCINLLLYQWSKNYLTLGGILIHTHFVCGISVSHSLVFCTVSCIYHCLSVGRCFFCTLTCLCIARHRW